VHDAIVLKLTINPALVHDSIGRNLIGKSTATIARRGTTLG